MNNNICNGAVSSSELLKAQSHIWNHIFNFINSASLKCAVQMGIPDIIHNHGKPMTLAALLSSMPVHHKKTQHVYRLMRLLTHSGFFAMRRVGEESEEEGYVLTPSSSYLLSGNPLSVAPFLLAMLDRTLIKPWDCMNIWLNNDDLSPFETTFGRSIWEQAGFDPQLNSFFNDAMASDARLITSVVLDKCGGVFEGLNSLVDVGGGVGIMARALAEAFPDLNCINFDLPHVVAGLEAASENMKYVEGDMFESIPEAHAILLKWILHDWSDEECIKILVKCKEAILKSGKRGGKVIIIDMVVNGSNLSKQGDMEAAETQLFFDMLMMALTSGGKEREEEEWAELFKKSGFNTYKITPVIGLRSLIEVFP
uniref:Uncharacterized protein n=1 Tax=Kalanchoe fedtschenkoi TaxID=63787 RepID=A0A7N0V2Q8_KALFE